ncbi:MAG: hypothetical protein GX579_15335 [Chloroflexi bacterium]|nr:hypothetical protein [Chloroflexota bacterium]
MPLPRALRGIAGITLFLMLCLFGLPACAAPPASTPTSAPVAEIEPLETARIAPTVAPTWTRPARPEAESTPARELVATPRPTRTPAVLPTSTPLVLATATTAPTATATATETPTPAQIEPPAPPAGQPNLLPNPSFEEGWYHPGGIDELQIPNRWAFEWEEGTNHLDPDPWNAWVRPEVRVLTAEFLPPQEHSTFIWDGEQTLKVFKGSGAISFRLKTSVFLEPGTYLFVIRVFPDLVDAYLGDGQKVWAPDPLSGEVAFIVDGVQQPWQFPRFGQKNEYRQQITVDEAGLVELGAAVRGRWAITNNGWFLDNWALYPLQAAQPDSG